MQPHLRCRSVDRSDEWFRVLQRQAHRTESTTAFLNALAARNLPIASIIWVSGRGVKWTAGCCLLDFGPSAFSARVVYRRALFARHSGVFYEFQGNNRNSGALGCRIIRSQDRWVKNMTWVLMVRIEYRRFVGHGPRQSESRRSWYQTIADWWSGLDRDNYRLYAMILL